jgi:proteasome lid subunit RPN8/RPN11
VNHLVDHLVDQMVDHLVDHPRWYARCAMRIGRDLYEEIIAHAREEAPKECVGVVSVRDGAAVKVHRARNAEDSRLRFSIDSKELYDLLMGIEDAGLDMGAIYHSHTRTAPRPSQTDINFAQGWPGVLWIIVGLGEDEPEVRTWEIRDGAVSEAELIVQ